MFPWLLFIQLSRTIIIFSTRTIHSMVYISLVQYLCHIFHFICPFLLFVFIISFSVMPSMFFYRFLFVSLSLISLRYLLFYLFFIFFSFFCYTFYFIFFVFIIDFSAISCILSIYFYNYVFIIPFCLSISLTSIFFGSV